MRLSELDHPRLANELLIPTLRAGAAIMGHRRHGFSVEAKADASPVTAADREAEEIVLEALARIAPGVPVVAEEATSRGQSVAHADAMFLVDPLDGTREFVSGGTDFTINIGLIVDREPRFGLIYAPAIRCLVATVAADRALDYELPCDARPESLSSLNGVELRTRDPDPDNLIAIASRSHLNEATRRFLDQKRIASCRNIGSSLKFCLLARGEADIYPRFGGTCEWDTAAGHAILLAAGGAVTTTAGQPFHYAKSDRDYLNPGFIAWGRSSLIRLLEL
jgi:3'(2'), 5'-bisphosphate nucleotidase